MLLCGVARTFIGCIALDDGAVHLGYQRRYVLRTQIVLVALLARVNLYCHLARQICLQLFVERQDSFWCDGFCEVHHRFAHEARSLGGLIRLPCILTEYLLKYIIRDIEGHDSLVPKLLRHCTAHSRDAGNSLDHCGSFAMIAFKFTTAHKQTALEQCLQSSPYSLIL